MIYLLLTILLNAVLFILFKLFPAYRINTLQAIVVNYITCVVTGCLFLGEMPVTINSPSQAWFPWALAMGCMYIGLFNFIAYCTSTYGVGTASVANKLSLVIPVAASIWLYDERLSVINIIGIIIALPAVYLSIISKKKEATEHGLLLPAMLFVFSGTLDAITKYVEHHHLQDVKLQAVFPIHVFAVAASIGIVLITILVIAGKSKLHIRNIAAGILLGIPNYFSIYYLIRMLNDKTMQSATSIALNNIGIVLVSALAAVWLLHEKLTKQKLAGLLLAVLSIVLIAWRNG
ncbi:hypothetical protein CAP35_07170 [Chitinophagaceae bacterium IBVUCB1]|nr:hypothetical protein CAP35_07170 [Chitinophagaceae bacterium IBVUCB1]